VPKLETFWCANFNLTRLSLECAIYLNAKKFSNLNIFQVMLLDCMLAASHMLIYRPAIVDTS